MTEANIIHHELVQSRINEVLREEKNRKQIKIEIESILQGYMMYLESEGFGGLELQLILNKLEFNRLWIS